MVTNRCFHAFVIALTLLALTSTASAGHGKLLYRFPYGPDGANSQAPLVLDSSGSLYGTAPYGGLYGAGMVFKLTPTGSGHWTNSVLYSFRGAEDGAMPRAGLILDSAGNLYGTTSCGGASAGTFFGCPNGGGVVFKLSPRQGEWKETVLHSFSGAPDGAYPAAGLVFDELGNLYGTTEFGGSALSACSPGCGVVFKLSPSQNGTWIEKVIYTFYFDYNSTEGAYPTSDLVFDGKGNLYGTTSVGPSRNNGGGIVFQLTPTFGDSWTETIIYNLSSSTVCCFLGPELAFDDKGNLFGSASSDSTYSGVVFELQPRPDGTWNGSILYSFTDPNNGEYPTGKIVLDDMGNLFGTTLEGGGPGCYGNGCGVVFQLTSNSGVWTETVLLRLGGGRGCCSEGGLVRDPGGSLLATAAGGGDGGVGSIFELSPGQNGWTPSLLHTFHSAGHGAYAQGGLVADASGNLFGTTQAGGTHDAGSVFELDSTGKQSVLYSFAGGKDGQAPLSKLAFDTAGNLYGTTLYGGDSNCDPVGCGTVFEISPNPGGNWTEKIIHAFGVGDGRYPTGGLVFDTNGSLYGAAPQGGAGWDIGGVIFQLTPAQDGSWKETIIYSFAGGDCNGPEVPNGDLVFDEAGYLYGTTYEGTAVPRGCGAGTVFRLAPPQHGGYWIAQYLYSFGSVENRADGFYPSAGVILDSAGNIYGTTSSGGDTTCRPVGGCGGVFKLDPGRNETLLYSFKGGTDGAIPRSGLALDPFGNLYGTTSIGGGKGVCNGLPGNFCGTLFQLVPGDNGSWTENILHRFSGPDGGNPSSGVLLGLSGHRLFGTTPYGGIGGANNLGNGVIYELDR